MQHLKELEERSIYILREAYYQFNDIAMLWSIGKDSTAMLWLARKAFFGKLPFPVVHIDTGYKFKEIYEYRDAFQKEWGLDLIISQNEAALKEGVGPDKEKLSCCAQLKTEALKQTIDQYNYEALFLAIRRDEHGIRAKERYFSPRDQGFKWNYEDQPTELWEHYNSKMSKGDHYRIHPMLHWTEQDIWNYILQEKIPIVDLYFAKGGKRFRSIGCECCCAPVKSNANTLKKVVQELEHTKISERSGRAQDKENVYTMQKLRSLGYM